MQFLVANDSILVHHVVLQFLDQGDHPDNLLIFGFAVKLLFVRECWNCKM